MDTQAQLYLSDQRGCSQIEYFRSFHTFNFGQYIAENRKPVGRLQVVNDNTLKAGSNLRVQVKENTDVLIIPVIGGLEYKSELDSGFLEAGQVQVFSLSAGKDYEISNPYKTEFINYLEIWLLHKADIFIPKTQQTSFDLADKNKLLPFVSLTTKPNGSQQQTKGFIGRYDGRKEGVYQASVSTDSMLYNSIFIFILSGVFEVQNRLLHERDGLSLFNTPDGLIEFEALSNDAILLLLEIPL